MSRPSRWIRWAATAVCLAAMAGPALAQAPPDEPQPATDPPGEKAAAPSSDPAPPTQTDAPPKAAGDDARGPAAGPRAGEQGAAPGKASADLEAQREAQRNWLGQIFGWGMVPLWICSVALVALVIERRRALKTEKIIDPAMVERVADLVGRLEVGAARSVAEASPTVVGRAWAQGLHEFSLGGMALVEALTNATVVAFKPLKRNLAALATLGVISPLFGLLGTVLGMIITFGQIASTGGADKADLAEGIGLALFTTAGGLIVAIPAILSNRYFTARLTGIAERAEEAINRINYRYSHATAEAEKHDDADKLGAAATGKD